MTFSYRQLDIVWPLCGCIQFFTVQQVVVTWEMFSKTSWVRVVFRGRMDGCENRRRCSTDQYPLLGILMSARSSISYEPLAEKYFERAGIPVVAGKARPLATVALNMQ